MKQEKIIERELKLVGISRRTSNALEGKAETAIIASTLDHYFSEVQNKIQHRQKPGVTYCLYTEYESDEHGPYTYFVGESVVDFAGQDPNFAKVTLPPSSYIKFTVGPGKMPDVCIQAWQKIWSYSSEELGGERSYIGDFEVYDERSHNPSKSIFDIYLGLKS